MSRLRFVRKNIFGSTKYEDTTHRFQLVEHDSKFYVKMGTQIPEWQGDGFESVTDAEDFLNKYDWEYATVNDLRPKDFQSDLVFLLLMYGFSRSDVPGQYLKEMPDGYICINDLGNNQSVNVYTESGKSKTFESLDDVAKYLDDLLSLGEIEIFSCAAICNPSETKTVVQAAITTRDLAKNLVRVKSSNVWAYTINIKDRHDKVGDVLVQFKGPKGGPGDIYLYYDVPVTLWRRWLSAPSKGHFFWAYIRNTFSYRKLTGDRKGKLKNAIN